MSNEMADRIVAHSEELAGAKTKDWGKAHWDAFQAGWQKARHGSPDLGHHNPRFFEVGKKTADFAKDLAAGQSS